MTPSRLRAYPSKIRLHGGAHTHGFHTLSTWDHGCPPQDAFQGVGPVEPGQVACPGEENGKLLDKERVEHKEHAPVQCRAVATDVETEGDFGQLSSKAYWMHPTLRAYLAATRPWSVPASLVPVAVAGAALWRFHGTRLLTVDFLLVVLGVLLVHLAGNLVNTFYDYKKGFDTDRHADDRTLVDGLLPPRHVAGLAVTCLAPAAAIMAWLT
eukprot:gene3123-3661_t